ncbi:class I SAM-dependent methyltransferase [Oxynema aestuarii]|uniref:Class I SAM-dependent methyltransferase n=1 Tax=Oxynema aestuarii AP17 TaxID=2064643 RepID=A0A6H1TT81_9CYAN|nr:class I SAM-dependent methyltransferase [Oxynema aestuarii]QIZ69751.1 class I SAM-dependent methyltransferase [Oxynema aestuarii AP17]
MNSNNNKHECQVCGQAELEPFFKMLEVPIYCNLLWSQREGAIACPKGDIELAFCPNCGFIYNTSFNPEQLDYSQEYENSLHYSPRFQQYADDLAKRLIQQYDLHGKDIIEVGSGKGDFLVALCQFGDNRGVGFDPTYIPRSEHHPMAEKVTFVCDYYSEKYREYQADLICCRHTLEHVPDPNRLLNSLRAAIGDRLDTAVFFEVPNALHTFQNLAVWDIIYEHCGYFSPASLTHSFIASGFTVKAVEETFESQFLTLDALPTDGNGSVGEKNGAEVTSLARDLAEFKNKFDKLVATWQEKLGAIAETGKKAVVWGAGSKGVTFLNILKAHEAIAYIVDINPRKQGMYVPGTGQPIVAPEFLKEYQPDLVIVMNPIYQAEISEQVASFGVNAEVISV